MIQYGKMIVLIGGETMRIPGTLDIRFLIIGLILFTGGIYASQWENMIILATAVTIIGGFLIGLSPVMQLFKK